MRAKGGGGGGNVLLHIKIKFKLICSKNDGLVKMPRLTIMCSMSLFLHVDMAEGGLA